MPLSLANKITFLRLFCIPFFVLLLLYYDRTVHHGVINHGLRLSASILFIVTFISDAIDGYIARAKKQITRLGTILDPLVDPFCADTAHLCIKTVVRDEFTDLVCLACHLQGFHVGSWSVFRVFH
jgi:phosphatidylglycerophosphate synthase